MNKLLLNIKRWFKGHNPKRLFCMHEYYLCGEYCNSHSGPFSSYRCSKCGKQYSIEQKTTQCNTLDNNK